MARPRQVTDEQILAAMRASVLEHGPQVSLDVVAERLSVTSPALLKRFGNRQELMLQALRPPENPPLLARFEAGPDERPLAPQLRERFQDLMDFFEEVVPCVTALRESGIPHDRIFSGKRQNHLRLLTVISKWLDLAHDARVAHVEAASSAAMAILGAVQTRAFSAHIGKLKYTRRSQHQYLDDLVELFSKAFAIPTTRQESRRSSSSPLPLEG